MISGEIAKFKHCKVGRQYFPDKRGFDCAEVKGVFIQGNMPISLTSIQASADGENWIDVTSMGMDRSIGHDGLVGIRVIGGRKFLMEFWNLYYARMRVCTVVMKPGLLYLAFRGVGPE